MNSVKNSIRLLLQQGFLWWGKFLELKISSIKSLGKLMVILKTSWIIMEELKII